MSEETKDGAVEASEASGTQVELRYAGSSRVVDEGDGARIALVGDGSRAPVRLRAAIKRPLLVREALGALYEVVRSDTRRAPKDRAAYLAYSAGRSSGSGADLFQAQREYFDWLAQNDAAAWLVLDPVVTVHPDGTLFEVFSKDEGSYASLKIGAGALEPSGETAYGTTNIDFSQDLFDAVQRVRSYRTTELAVGQDAVTLGVEGAAEVVEKRVEVPHSWLRGFLQVQAAATLAPTSCTLAPIDLYNVLRQLRLNADQKGGGRAIRVELSPGERPRLVLEPWETVLETHGEVYKGRTAQVVRIWGRRRLGMLRRLLPWAESIELHLLGTGLPSFYVVRCGDVTFTMGLTGFTASNWSQALNLDTLLPRTEHTSTLLDQALELLGESWIATADALTEALGASAADVREALRLGCQNGQVMYDLDLGAYRLRPLSDAIDPDALAFKNARERLAYDLLAGKGGGVKILSENRIQGVGTQYVGEVRVDADRREYRCEMTIDEEGRVKKVDDTSPFFAKHQLKEGPSAPLIALRLEIAQVARARAAERGADTITYETRTYVKRDERGESVYQVSLEERRVKVRWGLRAKERMRSQNLMFGSVDDARRAYLERIGELEDKGFMDATAG